MKGIMLMLMSVGGGKEYSVISQSTGSLEDTGVRYRQDGSISSVSIPPTFLTSASSGYTTTGNSTTSLQWSLMWSQIVLRIWGQPANKERLLPSSYKPSNSTWHVIQYWVWIDTIAQHLCYRMICTAWWSGVVIVRYSVLLTAEQHGGIAVFLVITTCNPSYTTTA